LNYFIKLCKMRYKSVTYVSDVYSLFLYIYADYMLKEILLIFIS
jgi:hypothetical protein